MGVDVRIPKIIIQVSQSGGLSPRSKENKRKLILRVHQDLSVAQKCLVLQFLTPYPQKRHMENENSFELREGYVKNVCFTCILRRRIAGVVGTEQSTRPEESSYHHCQFFFDFSVG